MELTAQLMGFSTESVRKTILTALEKLKHSNYSERLQEGVSWIYYPPSTVMFVCNVSIEWMSYRINVDNIHPIMHYVMHTLIQMFYAL